MVSNAAGLPFGSLWEGLEQRARLTPDALFAADDAGGRCTFADAWHRAASRASVLLAAGVEPGQTVAWQLPTTIDAMVTELALSRLRAVQIPMIPQLRMRELTSILEQTTPQWLLTVDSWRGFDHASLARSVTEATDARTLLLDDLDPNQIEPLPPWTETPASDVEEDFVFFTSGTTSAPKGARHTHGTLIATVVAVATRMEVTAADRNSVTYPFAHIGGTIDLTLGLLTGMGNLLTPVFDFEASPRHLGELGVTLAGYSVPHWLAYIAVQHASSVPIMPAVREFPGGGAVKTPAIHEELLATFGVGSLPSYGLTEAPNLTCAAPSLDQRARATTEGDPLPGVRLRVVDDNGRVLGTNVEGELQARAPQMMLGYVDATLDAEAFTADGWFRTGDLGRVDDAGNVVITGRLKDVIIRNGENISAREITDLLAEHPDVRDVEVIGLPDARTGERVCAVVVGSVDESALAQHLIARGLIRQKMPTQYEFVRDLPRNPSGKVDRRELERRFGPS